MKISIGKQTYTNAFDYSKENFINLDKKVKGNSEFHYLCVNFYKNIFFQW